MSTPDCCRYLPAITSEARFLSRFARDGSCISDWVKDYRTTPSEHFYNLNTITVREGVRDPPLFLLRVSTPQVVEAGCLPAKLVEHADAGVTVRRAIAS